MELLALKGDQCAGFKARAEPTVGGAFFGPDENREKNSNQFW